MKFSEVVEQVIDLLQRQRRVSYRMLKREFTLDDDDVEDLKAEIIDVDQVSSEDGSAARLEKQIHDLLFSGANEQTAAVH